MKGWTSRIFRLIAWIYGVIPVFFLVWVWLLYRVPGGRLLSIILSPTYILTSILCFATMGAMQKGKRASWYMVAVLSIFLVYLNAFTLAEYGRFRLQEGLFFLCFVLGVLLLLIRVKTEMRVPYLFPRVKWWERVTIEYCSLAVAVFRENGTLAEGQIIDLSIGGCFFKSATDFKEGESLLLKFVLEDESYNVSGQVVWKAMSAVTHPKGVGVMFGPIERKTKRRLKRRISRIPVAEKIQDD